MRISETKKNIVGSIILQFATIISGLIIPRIVLGLFGSDVNGLISSINQFLNYIQLIEGGLGGVVMAALYKPLREKDEKKISGIINATSSFFKKIGLIYVSYLVLLAFIYPIFVDTGFNYSYSIALIIVLGTNTLVQYFFSITYKLLLNADRKVFVVSITQSIIILLNVLMVIVCSLYFKDVLIIKIVSALVFVCQPFFFSAYVKKNYNINNNEKEDTVALSQRWVAFGTNLAYFIHTNTDIVILTIFSTLSQVSIYSVYLLVINALKGLIVSISSAIVPSFGRALASDNNKEIVDSFEKYEMIIHLISFLLFSCGAVLVVPFVLVYTNGINDANYNQPVFAALIVFAEFFYCIRDPYVQATSAAGLFKIIAPYAYVEALLNVLISISLVSKLGIIGVAIGTIVAMVFRMISQIVLVNKNVLKKKSILSIVRVILLTIILVLIYLLFIKFGPKSIQSYGKWFVYACVVFGINSIVMLLLAIVFYCRRFLELFKN